jgi:hypothetical protein
MTKPIARDPIYRRRRFEAEIIELCVRWYITVLVHWRRSDKISSSHRKAQRRFRSRNGWKTGIRRAVICTRGA